MRSSAAHFSTYPPAGRRGDTRAPSKSSSGGGPSSSKLIAPALAATQQQQQQQQQEGVQPAWVLSPILTTTGMLMNSTPSRPRQSRSFEPSELDDPPSDPGAADSDTGFYWNSLPFGELLWILMRILIRIHKNSPNGTEFQPAENGYFSADPYQRLSPESGSDGTRAQFSTHRTVTCAGRSGRRPGGATILNPRRYHVVIPPAAMGRRPC